MGMDQRAAGPALFSASPHIPALPSQPQTNFFPKAGSTESSGFLTKKNQLFKKLFFSSIDHLRSKNIKKYDNEVCE